jgi:hypothetical protein
MESLTRSIEEWERAEHNGAIAAKDSIRHSPQHVLSSSVAEPEGDAEQVTDDEEQRPDDGQRDEARPQGT